MNLLVSTQYWHPNVHVRELGTRPKLPQKFGFSCEEKLVFSLVFLSPKTHDTGKLSPFVFGLAENVVNPLNPNSDQQQISPFNINAYSQPRRS